MTEISNKMPRPPELPNKSTTPITDKSYRAGRAFILSKHLQKQSDIEVPIQTRAVKGCLNNSYSHIANDKEQDNSLNKSSLISKIANALAIDNIKQSSNKKSDGQSKKSLNTVQDSTEQTFVSLNQRNYTTLEPEGIEDMHNIFVLYHQKQKKLLAKMEKADEGDIQCI